MSITSVIRYALAKDTSVSTGAGKTGLAFGDFTAKYLVKGGTLIALTTETITTLGTYQAPTSNAHLRIKELANADPTKGIYEIHFHNDQMASAGKRFWLFLSATGANIQPLEIDLIPYVYHDNTSADDFKDFVDTGYDPANHLVVTDVTQTSASEPGQGAPPASTNRAAKIDYLYKLFRNKIRKTATEIDLYADDGTTIDQKATITTAGTTETRGEIISGP